MINVDEVFQSVRALIRKDKGGYITNAEFNRISVLAETMLWNFWAQQFDKTQSVPTALRPFITKPEDDLYVGDEGNVELPDNFGRLLGIQYGVVTNSAANTSVTAYYPSQPCHESEISNLKYSAVRGPSLARKRFYHVLTGDYLTTYPAHAGNVVSIRYLAIPTFAVRGVTTDSTNDQENYSSGTSTNYMWPDSELNNLIDVILLHYGMSIRESELVSWVQTQRGIAAGSAAQTI